MRRTHKGVVRLGILISGRGSNMVALAESARTGILKGLAKVAVVISDQANAPGLEKARKMGIPTATVLKADYPKKEIHDAAVVEVLNHHKVELVCLAGYMRIVSSVLLEAFPDHVFNIHPSLLPAFPGRAAQHQAWEHGVKYSGCTVHVVWPEVDSGPIILQALVKADKARHGDELATWILGQEHRAYGEAVRLYAEGRLVRQGARRIVVKSPPVQRKSAK